VSVLTLPSRTMTCPGGVARLPPQQAQQRHRNAHAELYFHSIRSVNSYADVALATFDWCSVCGLPFNGAGRWQVAPGDDWKNWAQDVGFVFNEAPAHEICLVYAAHVCPHLSSPRHRLGDEYRAGQRREGRMYLVGFRRTSQVHALESELQLLLGSGPARAIPTSS